MKNVIKNRITKAFSKVMEAIIRLAIRNGVSYGEFSMLSKSLYVKIAAHEYGLQGRQTNDSRISLITGLDRREIKRLRQVEQDDSSQEASSPDRMAKILSAWSSDPKYIDHNQQPLLLDLDAGANSFSQLIKEYGGDIAPVTVLREFKRSQVVSEMDDGKLKLLRRYFIPNYSNDSNKAPEFVEPEKIEHGGSMLIDHIDTIFHNLYREDTGQRTKLELRATNKSIRKSQVEDFYSYIDKAGMDFLVQVDEWLTLNEVKDEDMDKEETERLGVGLYFIEGKNTLLEAVKNA